MKIGILFSGQGSQFAQMGIDFLTQEQIKCANQILGYDVLTILRNEENQLNDTYYTQPMMVLVEMAMYDHYIKKNRVDGLLGFSLGEFTAFYAAGIYDFETTLRIIQKRATYMQEAALKHPGSMAAVLNLEPEKIEHICQEINQQETLVCANYNAKNQIVISGTNNAIEKAITSLKEQGAKRVIKLNVSGAFHSPLMKEAGMKLRKFLNDMETKPAQLPIYLNTTAQVLKDNEILMRIEQQIQSPVYFYQSVEQMIKDGYTHLIEIGPGNVLSQLVKRNYPTVKVYNIEKKEDLNHLEGWY